MEPSSDSPKRRRTWPAWGGCVAGGLALLFAIFRLVPPSESEARLEALRKLGYPTTLKELAERQPQGNDSENLNSVVIEAGSELRASRAPGSRSITEIVGSIPPNEPWPEDVKQSARDFVEHNRGAFEKVPELLRRPNGWTKYDFSKGFPSKVPQAMEVLNFARALDVKAGLDIEEKRPHDAVQAILAIFATAHGRDREPFLILQVSRIITDSLACGAISRLLNHSEIGDADLLTLQQLAASRGDLKTLEVGMVGDFCMGLDAFDRGPAYLVGIFGSARSRGAEIAEMTVYSTLGLLRRDRACYIEFVSESLRIYRMQPWERFEPAAEWQQRFSRVPSEWYRGQVLSRMMLSSLQNVIAQEARAMARLRCTASSLALERYRKAHDGQYPDSLAALVPDFMASVPLDPFDGKPLRFVKRPAGYIVYSPGPDRDDDQGRGLANDRSNDDYDLSVTVEH